MATFSYTLRVTKKLQNCKIIFLDVPLRKNFGAGFSLYLFWSPERSGLQKRMPLQSLTQMFLTQLFIFSNEIS